MKKILLLFKGLILLLPFLTAQDDIDYDDVIYDQNIGAVEFRLRGQYTGYPLLNLKGGSTLTLSFDDFSEENRYLNYKIILCNADWTPSTEEYSYYLNGFNDNEIEDYEFSFNTRANFVNYRVHIPNDDVSIIQPGNYVLHVYDTDLELPVLTRRFLVLQEKFVISPEVVRTNTVEFQRTHHEIDFEINTLNENVTNPDANLKIFILQNWRWDDAITDLSPRFIKNGILNYNYSNKIIFPAGNEFRKLDARSFDFLTIGMEHIDIFDDGYGVHMQLEESRAYSSHYSFNDLNGDFIIQNLKEAVRNSRGRIELDSLIVEQLGTDNNSQAAIDDIRQERFTEDIEILRANKLRADYGNFYFRFASAQEIYNKDVYVVGQFSNWKTNEKNRMIYDSQNSFYEGNIELKQGYYDYLFVTTPKGETTMDITALEGSHFETRNSYVILVYHRGTGDRHDRLLGFRSFSSGRN